MCTRVDCRCVCVCVPVCVWMRTSSLCIQSCSSLNWLFAFDDDADDDNDDIVDSLRSVVVVLSALVVVAVVIVLFTTRNSQLLSRSSTGDNVELVDGDFDDDNDDDVEHSMGIRDENLLRISLAVNTSSSSSLSISESELLVADAAGDGTNLPVARKFCSSSNNWPMKLRFGEMIGRANLTKLYASNSDIDLYRMTYAMAIVALLEMPAWQCNNTVDPLRRASSAKKTKKNFG